MKPKIAEVETYLDQLEFGEYVPHENDCDVQASTARHHLETVHPDWVTGISIMYGLTFALEFVGHGILVVKCKEGDFYYDCTTQDGKDTRRHRGIGWRNMWWKYLTMGFFILYHYDEWGDYTPSAFWRRRHHMTPWFLFGRLFDKVQHKTFII